MVIEGAAPPGEAAPPLSPPAGHGTTHGGAYLKGTLILPSARSQSGAARAAAVPWPALRGATGATCASPPAFALPPALPPAVPPAQPPAPPTPPPAATLA